MIASLPMYDRPSNRDAHDAFWALIRDGLRARGIEAPDDLDRDTPYSDGWARPDLVVGQICNLPYRAQFRDSVTLIGAADYALPDCKPGFYNSVFVVHEGSSMNTPQDFATTRFACNSLLSHSGYGAPQDWANSNGFLFTDPMITGAHSASVEAVANGQADIAAIDAQVWCMLQREGTETKHLRVIGYTDITPGQSFITRADQDPAPYFDAISHAISNLPIDAKEQLGINAVIKLPKRAYDIPLPPTVHQNAS